MFGLAFRQVNYYEAFMIMGSVIMGSSILSMMICIKGYGSMLWGKDTVVDKNTGMLVVPEVDAEAKAEVNK